MRFAIELEGDALDVALAEYCYHLRGVVAGSVGIDKLDAMRDLVNAENGKPNRQDMGAWLMWSGLKAAAQDGHAITEWESGNE